MTKSELTRAVYDEAKPGDFSSYAACERAVNNVWDIITEQLIAKAPVSIAGFGQFESVVRAQREGHNPQTGEAMTIPESNGVRFKAYKALKDSLNA